MAKIGIDISDEIAGRLRDFTLKRYGVFRGQSKVVEEALDEYLQKKEDAPAQTSA
jgi:metal-responsive CopG/Arc/MetJ family transcriptional regulator